MESKMDINKKIREHISGLSDGELAASDLELAIAALRARDGEQAWEVYHRIGDALRAQATPELSDGFSERLAARLVAEPAPVRRGALQPPTAAAPVASAPPDLKKVAATS